MCRFIFDSMAMIGWFSIWIIAAIGSFLSSLAIVTDKKLGLLSKIIIGASLAAPPVFMLAANFMSTSAYPFIYSVYFGIFGVLIGSTLTGMSKGSNFSKLAAGYTIFGLVCLGGLALLNYLFTQME